jgi:hypothetical protein
MQQLPNFVDFLFEDSKKNSNSSHIKTSEMKMSQFTYTVLLLSALVPVSAFGNTAFIYIQACRSHHYHSTTHHVSILGNVSNNSL